MTAHPLTSSHHTNHTHSLDRRRIANVAIGISWVLFSVGAVLTLVGQLEVASLAFLAGASAGVAVVGTTPRNAAGWVTAAVSRTALIRLLGASVVLAATHA